MPRSLARDFRSNTGAESNCRIIQYESLITRHSSPVTHHQSRAFSDPPTERGVLIAQERKKKNSRASDFVGKGTGRRYGGRALISLHEVLGLKKEGQDARNIMRIDIRH